MPDARLCYQTIAIHNANTNFGILALNEKLGFHWQIGWVTMEKVLFTAEPSSASKRDKAG